MKVDAPTVIGRPRSFDADRALEAALQVFWRQGYQSASLRDLTQAMCINSPSLYGAFGDKEQLFLAAVDRYLQIHGRNVRAALEAPGPLEHALRAFFRACVVNTTGAVTPPGCLVACVLVGAANESATIAAKLAETMAMADGMVERRLRQAESAGELAPEVDVAGAARLANSLRHGLAMRARAGESAQRLLRDADGAAEFVVSYCLRSGLSLTKAP